ncbi:MAG: DUF1800 domain-containing protein [Planctomycetota bacterium]|nr:MAG: DUF1800 domain-containing protein [Planctomycetota bacterium]
MQNSHAIPADLRALDVGAPTAHTTPLFDTAAARHLLNRAGFGGTQAQVDALVAMGLDHAVDLLVNFETQPSKTVNSDDFDRDLMPPLNREERTALNAARASREEAEVERLERKENQAKANDRRQLVDLKKWWIARMIESARPLEEKMTLFWHGHFATGARTIEDSWHMFQQNQLFRTYATGNFGMLVLNVIRDPAMIKYLDNDKSRKGRPNENLARELLELFILGEGSGYTEDDIKAGARALTGYTFEDDDFDYRDGNHDAGPKTIFGKEGNWTGDEFARLALAKTACSEFIASKLYRYFVNDTPAADLRAEQRDAREAFIRALATELRTQQYEIKPVLAKLFRSAHFHHASNRAATIKSPAQLIVQTIRQYGTPPRQLSALAGACDLMGQDLFQPPNVKGWDGGRAWINTSTLFVRQNVAIYLLTGKRPDVYDWENDETRFDPIPLLGGATTPDAVTDRLISISLAAPPHPERRAALVSFLTSQTHMEASEHSRTIAALALVTALPEYQLA